MNPPSNQHASSNQDDGNSSHESNKGTSDKVTSRVSSGGGEDNTTISHKARYYQTFPGAGYVLPSDAKEQARLKLQHELLKRVWDNKLVFIPTPIHGSSKILDCGTGSAAWLLDVSHQVEDTVSLHGIDIEKQLFPLHPPSNMTLAVESVLTLPSHWSQTFDFVHQRLLMVAFGESQWNTALTEIYRVLKPGGWVQLEEMPLTTRRAGPKTLTHLNMLHKLLNHRGILLDCPARLPDMLLEAGFTDVRMETRMIPLGQSAGQNGDDGRENWMDVYRALKTPVLNLGGLGFCTTEAEFDRLMDEIEVEWRESQASKDYTMFVARKPQN